MTLQMIKPREVHQGVNYFRSFEWNDMPGAGFSFECDKQGNIDRSKFLPIAIKNLEMCLADKGKKLIDNGVIEHPWQYRTGPVYKCTCGREIECDRFTNTCECGADYNMSGSRLAPRSQWGWDTGESVADILQADQDYEDYKWRQQIGEAS